MSRDFQMTSWRACPARSKHCAKVLDTPVHVDGQQKMHSSRRFYSLLNISIRRGTTFVRSSHSGQRVWRPAVAGSYFQSHEVDDRSRRLVHSSGPWPNTQPHVLNGDGGATDLHQLTTVEDLKAWFEARKKEIYGMWGWHCTVWTTHKTFVF